MTTNIDIGKTLTDALNLYKENVATLLLATLVGYIIAGCTFGILAGPMLAGLALMAAYFLGLVPLARRIRLGLYQGGVWAHRGFLAWPDVARIAFVETPEIVLLLTPRRSAAPFKLPVPPAEYGTVRKILEQKARSGDLHLDPALLGIA